MFRCDLLLSFLTDQLAKEAEERRVHQLPLVHPEVVKHNNNIPSSGTTRSDANTCQRHPCRSAVESQTATHRVSGPAKPDASLLESKRRPMT